MKKKFWLTHHICCSEAVIIMDIFFIKQSSSLIIEASVCNVWKCVLKWINFHSKICSHLKMMITIKCKYSSNRIQMKERNSVELKFNPVQSDSHTFVSDIISTNWIQFVCNQFILWVRINTFRHVHTFLHRSSFICKLVDEWISIGLKWNYILSSLMLRR